MKGAAAGVGEHLAAQVVPPAFQGGKERRPRGIVLEAPIHGEAVLGDQGGDVGIGRGQILDPAQERALTHLERRGDEAVRAVGGGVEAGGPILGRPADVVLADRLDDAVAGAAPGKAVGGPRLGQASGQDGVVGLGQAEQAALGMADDHRRGNHSEFARPGSNRPDQN